MRRRVASGLCAAILAGSALPAAAARFSPVELPLPAGPSVVAVLDANGDEALDLAVFPVANAPPVLLTQTQATVWESTPLPAEADGYLAVLAADLDNDQRTDLVVSGRSGAFVLVRSRGTGFRAPLRLDGGESFTAASASLSAGDVNDDGLLDIVESRNDGARGALKLWLSEPAPKGEPPKWRLVRPLGDTPCCVPEKALLADLDGDGSLDLSVASRDADLEIHRGRRGAEAVFEKQAHDLAGRWTHFDVGDADNDGDLDLLVFARHPAAALYLNDGGFRFRPATGALPAMTASGVAPRFADFNSDGRLDIAWSAEAILQQDDGLRFRLSPDGGPGPADSNYAVADINGDGYPDLLPFAPGTAPRLFLQQAGPYHWLYVRLRGDAGRAATGARVSAKLPDGHKTVRHLLLGDTVASSGAEGMLLGILRHTQVNTLEVNWPSGRYTRLDEPLVKRPIGFIEPPASEPRQIALANPVLEHLISRKPAGAPKICRRNYRPSGVSGSPKSGKAPPIPPATP